MLSKKKIQKNQKPTNLDIHFKYSCPNTECYEEHWFSINQIRSSKLRVVCDCGVVFQPKPIKKIKVVYKKTSSIKNVDKPDQPDTTIVSEPAKKATKIIVGLGYSTKEARQMVSSVQRDTSISNYMDLVKLAISNIGGLHE